MCSAKNNGTQHHSHWSVSPNLVEQNGLIPHPKHISQQLHSYTIDAAFLLWRRPARDFPKDGKGPPRRAREPLVPAAVLLPLQLGLDKWFDANVRETSNYSPNDECSATAAAADAVGRSETGCSAPPSSATYCDRPITPGKVPPPQFLSRRATNGFTIRSPHLSTKRNPWQTL